MGQLSGPREEIQQKQRGEVLTFIETEKIKNVYLIKTDAAGLIKTDAYGK